MTRSFILGLTLTLGVFLGACGDDDGPTNPGVLGSSANPERLAVDTPLTRTLPPAARYYVVFKTSTSGDYIPSLTSDQPMGWVLYQRPSGRAKAPESWTPLSSCGVVKKVGDTTCTVTGLDATTDYVLELGNEGSVDANYSLTVTQGLGVGSIHDPVEWVGSIADCTDTFEGRVGTRSSYFKITDLSRSGANGAYFFNLMSADADFHAYSDPGFSNLLASSILAHTGFDDMVVPVPEGGVFYLRADGSKTQAGTTFSFECD